SEAAMVHGKNIAKTGVLADIAENLGKASPDLFNFGQFGKAYNGAESRENFRQDLKKTRHNNIGRFPTLTINKGMETGIMITGFRPYEALLEAVNQVNP